jgi:hypothetical protein
MIEHSVNPADTTQGNKYGYSLKIAIDPKVLGKLSAGFTKLPLWIYGT